MSCPMSQKVGGTVEPMIFHFFSLSVSLSSFSSRGTSSGYFWIPLYRCVRPLHDRRPPLGFPDSRGKTRKGRKELERRRMNKKQMKPRMRVKEQTVLAEGGFGMAGACKHGKAIQCSIYIDRQTKKSSIHDSNISIRAAELWWKTAWQP